MALFRFKNDPEVLQNKVQYFYSHDSFASPFRLDPHKKRMVTRNERLSKNKVNKTKWKRKGKPDTGKNSTTNRKVRDVERI